MLSCDFYRTPLDDCFWKMTLRKLNNLVSYEPCRNYKLVMFIIHYNSPNNSYYSKSFVCNETFRIYTYIKLNIYFLVLAKDAVDHFFT